MPKCASYGILVRDGKHHFNSRLIVCCKPMDQLLFISSSLCINNFEVYVYLLIFKTLFLHVQVFGVLQNLQYILSLVQQFQSFYQCLQNSDQWLKLLRKVNIKQFEPCSKRCTGQILCARSIGKKISHRIYDWDINNI